MRTGTDQKLKFAAPRRLGTVQVPGIADGRYVAKLVETTEEFEAVLRLRSEVFRREIAGADDGTDFDEFDLRCEHLIVTDRSTGLAVGTYRLNSYDSASGTAGFYASGEFRLGGLSPEVLENAVELGRACIAKEHRNSRVLFLLWKVLANYLVARGKRYLFGCCSVFTQDGRMASKILQQLELTGCMHDSFRVTPLDENRVIPGGFDPSAMAPVDLPPLLKIYLRIGCRVCGEPALDREMGTVDYFVVFDLESIEPRYRKLFFGIS